MKFVHIVLLSARCHDRIFRRSIHPISDWLLRQHRTPLGHLQTIIGRPPLVRFALETGHEQPTPPCRLRVRSSWSKIFA